MKKSMKFSSVLALALTTAMTFAGNVTPEHTYTYSNPIPKAVKPSVVHRDNLVTVSILFTQTPVAVTITEADGTEIYFDRFANKESFMKKFDISQFPAGTYTFRFDYNDTSFTETVNKK